MHEHLKMQSEKAFMHFTKVYSYHTNTEKPWNELTEEEKQADGFEWGVSKWFCISKKVPLTQKDLEHHIKTCPENIEEIPGPNTKAIEQQKQCKSTYHHFYPSHPLTVYDVQLLLSVIGSRMLHFTENLE